MKVGRLRVERVLLSYESIPCNVPDDVCRNAVEHSAKSAANQWDCFAELNNACLSELGQQLEADRSVDLGDDLALLPLLSS